MVIKFKGVTNDKDVWKEISMDDNKFLKSLEKIISIRDQYISQPIVIQCEELNELKKQLDKLGFEIDIRPKAVTMGVKLDVDEIIKARNKMEECIHAHQS